MSLISGYPDCLVPDHLMSGCPKVSMKYVKKTQALLLIIFLLFLISTVISGLSPMLLRDINIRSTQQYGGIAYNLALTGIEKAKVAILYHEECGSTCDYNHSNYCTAGTCTKPGAPYNWYYASGGKTCSASDNYCDTAFPSGLMFRYQYSVTNPGSGSTTRNLTATGQVLGDYNNVLAQKTISCTVIGITTTSTADDGDLSGIVKPNTWKEQ